MNRLTSPVNINTRNIPGGSPITESRVPVRGIKGAFAKEKKRISSAPFVQNWEYLWLSLCQRWWLNKQPDTSTLSTARCGAIWEYLSSKLTKWKKTEIEEWQLRQSHNNFAACIMKKDVSKIKGQEIDSRPGSNGSVSERRRVRRTENIPESEFIYQQLRLKWSATGVESMCDLTFHFI